MSKEEIGLTTRPDPRDPFALMRQMTDELDRLFEGFPFGAKCSRKTTASSRGSICPG
jgi:hypothetical protein